jgi:hypothetical protein
MEHAGFLMPHSRFTIGSEDKGTSMQLVQASAVKSRRIMMTDAQLKHQITTGKLLHVAMTNG